MKPPNSPSGIYIHSLSSSSSLPPPPKTTIQVSNDIPIPSRFINFNAQSSVLEIDLEGTWEDMDVEKKSGSGEWKWPVAVEMELSW